MHFERGIIVGPGCAFFCPTGIDRSDVGHCYLKRMQADPVDHLKKKEKKAFVAGEIGEICMSLNVFVFHFFASSLENPSAAPLFATVVKGIPQRIHSSDDLFCMVAQGIGICLCLFPWAKKQRPSV